MTTAEHLMCENGHFGQQTGYLVSTVFLYKLAVFIYQNPLL